jgi:hypothetical protein
MDHFASFIIRDAKPWENDRNCSGSVLPEEEHPGVPSDGHRLHKFGLQMYNITILADKHDD